MATRFLVKLSIAIAGICTVWIIVSLPESPKPKDDRDTLRIGTFNLYYRNPNSDHLPHLLAEKDIDLADSASK